MKKKYISFSLSFVDADFAQITLSLSVETCSWMFDKNTNRATGSHARQKQRPQSVARRPKNYPRTRRKFGAVCDDKRGEKRRCRTS